MKKSLLARIGAIALVAVSAVSVVVASLAWFVINSSTNNETLDGEIGLRSYFLTGIGTEENPYVIATRRHLYNLSRLQNLGVFSEKNYFQIGYRFDGEHLQCIDESSGTPVYTDWLDMHGDIMSPIGNEGTPFVGDFNGNGVPIRNLNIEGSPDDIGFFGYVGYTGKVKGLVLDTCDIKSVGYTKTAADVTNQLYFPDVDHIFDQAAHKFASESNLIFHDLNDSTNTYLKSENGLRGVGVNNINAAGRTVDTYFYNGYFEPVFPSSSGPSDPFTYSWVSSSDVIREASVLDITSEPGETSPQLDPAIMIDMKPLADSVTHEEQGVLKEGFNGPDEHTHRVRISLYATVTNEDNIEFSRVIQSYVVTFHSNTALSYTDANHKYSMTVYCDYVFQSDKERVNNYHHGNNIGFLAGHLDGNMEKCYVYNSTISFAGETDSANTILTESDTGLVGEVGANVVDALDPDYGKVENGDIGVMNFTKIYYGIREDYKANDIFKAGRNDSQGADYACFDNQINSDSITVGGIEYESYFDSYSDYLRVTDTNPVHYITHSAKNVGSSDPSIYDPGDDFGWHNYKITQQDINNNSYSFNSVDFKPNKVIEDGGEEDTRGLGVFKIVTYSSGATNPYAEMGSSKIINSSDPKEKIYFSTAEYDHIASDNRGKAWPDGDPFRANTTPTYYDTQSYGYPFSRDFNYCFEMDLHDMDSCPAGYNYLANSDNLFLRTYLNSKLVDKRGDHVDIDSPRLGFMFRSSQNEKLYNLSSYMPIGQPGSKKLLNGKYYPSNSIVFHIDADNEAGANVSVVGNNADITIYDYKPNESNNNNTKARYTMKATSSDTIDFKRYFAYDVGTGVTDTQAHIADDNLYGRNALYAHIFTLPKGDYVIGASPESGSKANIYFLAVQGQNNGDLDNETQVEIGQKFSDVGFLLTRPTITAYNNSTLDIVKMDFAFDCNGQIGTLYAKPITEQSTGNTVLQIDFTSSPSYLTYLSSRTTEEHPHFYLKNNLVEREYYTYPLT